MGFQELQRRIKSMAPQTNEYLKHNSFLQIRNKGDSLKADVMRRIQMLRVSLENCKLNKSKKNLILKNAISDLIDYREPKESPFFTLSLNTVEEINRLDDSDIATYLYHRYRYEIFPQTQTLDNYPPYLQIEPSSICNYRCVFCYQTDASFVKRRNGFMGYMSLETFCRIIDEAEGNIEFISLASRGEPLLCPEIEEMLSYTRGKFLNLKMNTNASLLDERKSHAILQSGIQTLVFSADAAQEPLYSKLRVNGKLDNVLRNIRQFHEIKSRHYSDSKMITRVSGVKVNDNQNLDEMEEFWGELVDQVAFVKYNPWENVYESDPNFIKKSCSDLWRRMFIWWDGKVNPCDVDYRSELHVEDFTTQGLSDLWRSPAYELLREIHSNHQRSSKFPCNRCSVV